MQASQEIYARLDHGCRMQESTDRCGSAHSVGKPKMEGELRRFRKYTEKYQNEDGDVQRMLLYHSGMQRQIGEGISVTNDPYQ